MSGLGRGWDEYSAEERAIFTSHLMQEPRREKLKPEQVREKLTLEQYTALMTNLDRLSDWCSRGEDWLERRALRGNGHEWERI